MDERSELIAELGDTWFGAPLSPHARALLVQCASLREIPAGTILMREGQDTKLFGIVRVGRVGLQVLVPERGAVTILTVEPGDVVGWSALVPPHRSTSTAVTLEPSVILTFDGPCLRSRLAADEALAATLYPRLLQALGRRLTATRQQLLDLYVREGEAVPW